MRAKRCPVCRKSLTDAEYRRALGSLDAREKHLEHELAVAKQQAKGAHAAGVRAERSKTQRLLAGKDRVIEGLHDRIRQLQRGTTPQTDGLEFEDELAARLQREFPSDDVEPKGQGGDVLHTVRFEGKAAGAIIYECKRTPRIQSVHIRQAYRAQQARGAHFAVLVTTGAKRGFCGFTQSGGVFVVAPLGVVALAGLLRSYIVEMARARISKDKRARVAARLVQFVESRHFDNPIAEIVHVATELQSMVFDEARQHKRTWERRWERYQTIQWDGEHIRRNVQLVLHGKQPESLGRRSLPTLPRLPA